ncbi:MAG: glycosyltransferase [Candidatus Zixiibacteriota bacterium]|nr:MAG: glycosyltransferase [candidate division Zixibacteria bacterium]
MKFSLIMATVGRTEEPGRFLESLASQTWRDFELIAVDQNSDDRLRAILEQFRIGFPIIHVTSKRGLSRARNLGLKHIGGGIVAFPDDDCRYPPDLLSRVHSWLDRHPDYTGISGRSVDRNGNSTVGSFEKKPGDITRINIWRRTTSIALFLRMDATTEGLSFDPSLGAGAQTPWGSGEDIDFPLQALERGAKIYYDPALGVLHPVTTAHYNREAFKRAFSYGAGMGRVMKKYRYPFWFRARTLIRPLGGTALSLLSLRTAKAWYHLTLFRGRVRGLRG